MSTRRLAAIMFADIAGYTAMMQRNESEGIQKVTRFTAIMEEKASSFQGEVLEIRGDGSLSIFSSAVDALKCAQAIQLALQQAPKVPLRIGIHIGDIVIQDHKVYGDGVNLASRVESMGIPGSVLFTERILPDIKSHPELRASSLGKFHFKNVEEPMEVYALTNEGLAVPKASEVKGKFQPQKKPNWVIPSLVAVAMIIGLWLWSSYGEKVPSSPVPEEKERRVSVLSFENQTSDPSLEVFGKMTADWLSKGLLDTDKTQVVPEGNLQSPIELASMGNSLDTKTLQSLGKSSGLTELIHGNYYLIEDSLIIYATILDTETGKLQKSFDLGGSQQDMVQLLDRLTQEVLGYWMVKETKRFQQSPPTYAAYQEYIKGISMAISNPSEAANYFQKAYSLDSSFHEALFKLYSTYISRGDNEGQLKVLSELTEQRATMSHWETLKYESLLAFRNRKWLEAGGLSEQLYDLDPSDIGSGVNSAMLYSQANYPQKALDTWEKIDKRYITGPPTKLGWSHVTEMFIHYQLKRYSQTIAIANEYDLPLTPDAQAVMHCQSLVFMDSLDVLESTLEKYKEIGLSNNTGEPSSHSLLLIMVCDAFLLSDKPGLNLYAERLKDWAETHSDEASYHRNLGYAYFYMDSLSQAVETWKQEEIAPEDWPGWLRHTLQIEYMSRMGYSYGQLGDPLQAQAMKDSIQVFLSPYPGFSATKDYYLSRIYLGLGQKEQAVNSLNKAIEQGFNFFRPTVFARDPFLYQLYGYEPFEELVKPKG